MINTLVRDPHPLVSDHARLFLRDCLDHVVTVVELTETYREMCSDLRDYALTAVSYRLNEVMRVLTVIATIFMPLSFLASLYGMNFDTASPWNMPELTWRFGYLFALGLMGTVAIAMLIYFRWRGWLGPEWSHEGGRMESGERTNGVTLYPDRSYDSEKEAIARK
jgi:magnesium transporter